MYTPEYVLAERAERFAGGQVNIRRLTGNACYYYRNSDDNVIGLLLHNTVIRRKDDEDNEFITSGGYETATTKRLINKTIEPKYKVVQIKKVWYVVDRFGNKREFKDGMML